MSESFRAHSESRALRSVTVFKKSAWPEYKQQKRRQLAGISFSQSAFVGALSVSGFVVRNQQVYCSDVLFRYWRLLWL